MSLHTPIPWNAVAEGYAETTTAITEGFSRFALDWLAPGAGDHILDLATGPGTLSVLAAPRVAQVTAVDFSAEMLEICRRRVAGLPVTVLQADGQNLGHQDAFDAAFSLFGLLFFPDRLAGLRAMRRALKPGAWGCISTWLPPERSTGMLQAMGAVSAALPGWHPEELDRPSWDHPEIVLEAMAQAGFEHLEAVEHQVVLSTPASAEQSWAGVAGGFAPLALAKTRMPASAWQRAEARGLAWLRENPAESLSYSALLFKGRA